MALSLLDYRTWTFDGTDWWPFPVEGASPVINSFAGTPAVAIDQRTGGWVVFGGFDARGIYLSDTWVGNGNSWTQMSPATSPSARSGRGASMRMAWDPDRHRLVLFGGTSANLGMGRPPIDADFFVDTWAWDGTTWTKLAG